MHTRLSLCLLALLWAPVAALAAVTPARPAPAPIQADPTSAAPAPVPSPRVVLVTSLGEITLELDANAAPKTVANFLAYARDGHYNGTIFHRVIPGLLVQAGSFTPDLQHKPSRAPVASEAGNGLSNRRGTVAAARERGVEDSATAQFFFNLADNPQLDRSEAGSAYTSGYAVFGRVLQGLDVLDRIAAVPTRATGPFPAWVPETPVVIERVDLLEPASP
jgi:cyclophilin family peptidyl-prolyl cis-trans isomerase